MISALRWFTAAAVVLLAASSHAAWFMPLPQLPLSDGAGDALGVSADGSTIVGLSRNGVASEAVRWTLTGEIHALGTGDSSGALDVSADGSVIVGAGHPQGTLTAFRWTEASGPLFLGDLPGAVEASEANGVSSDGRVVVGRGRSEESGEAFRWTAATGMVGLGDLPGGARGSEAYATSADGSVIVGSALSAGGTEAFRWTASTGMVGLGDIPGGGFFSEAYDVSADGSIVVGRSVANSGFFPSRAFRWTADEGMTALPDVPGVGPTAIAQSISGDGSVIVGAATQGDSAAAFAWDQFHGTRRVADLLVAQGVDLHGFELGKAQAASFDGLTIVGIGLPANTRTFQPWVARLDPGTFIPEPSSMILSSSGVFAVLMAAWFLCRRHARTGGTGECFFVCHWLCQCELL